MAPAATFEAARAEFDEAWQRVLPRLSELRTPRVARSAVAPLPTQMADGQSRCFCGIEISIRNVHQHILRQHAYADPTKSS